MSGCRAVTLWSVQTANRGEGAPEWPRLTILHSFYRSGSPSGENATVIRQFEMLATAGVDVTLASVSSDELGKKLGYRLRSAVNVAFRRGASPEELLDELKPDVVHVHNLFPNIGTAWLGTCSSAVVASLHNYRPLCAAATLSRNGENCEACLTHSTWQAIRHRCYRNSAVATVPLAIRNARGPGVDPLLVRADALLSPSETVRSAYESAGVSGLQTLLQPTEGRKVTKVAGQRSVSVFLGRLTSEKGIMELLDSWPANHQLVVVGRGPLEADARQIAHRRGLDVQFCGYVDDETLGHLLNSAIALVFASSWREGAPAVYAESMAAGLPVISLKGNAVAEAVSADGTGVVVDALSEQLLAEAIETVAEEGETLRSRCSRVFEEQYTTNKWLEKIFQIYLEVKTKHHSLGTA